MPFLDLFKMSRHWLWENAWTRIDDKYLDGEGWIEYLEPPHENATAMTLVFRDIENYPEGEFIVTWDGQAELAYKGGARKIEESSRDRRHVINVTPTSEGIWILVPDTDPSDPIRDIKILPAAEDDLGRDTFNPAFLKILEPFQVIRFMDWQLTNNSGQEFWEDRPEITQATYTTKGVPIEVCIELCHTLKADAWFNLPHGATDNYAKEFALLIDDWLDQNRKVYIEYTNEAWNGIFEQHHWIKEEAKREGIDPNLWYAKRSAEVAAIFANVLGPQRCIGVLGAHSVNPGLSEFMLHYLKDSGWLWAIDAVAIAPYFGGYLGDPGEEERVQAMSLDELFKELEEKALPQAYEGIEKHVALCKRYHLPLVAYEGGQHLVGHGGVENNEKIMNLFIAANRDPRMGKLYRQYLKKWRELGGGLFCHWSDCSKPSKWGSWGMMEHLNDLDNPKYRALIA